MSDHSATKGVGPLSSGKKSGGKIDHHLGDSSKGVSQFKSGKKAPK